MLLLTACPCATGAPEVVFDGFDEDCDGPCEWDVQAGDATIVPTLHPGEHGLKLADGAVMERAIADVTVQDDAAQVDVLVRCDEGTSVRFTLVVGDQSPGRELVAQTTSDTSTSHFSHVVANLLDPQGQAQGGPAVLVRVALFGPGTCTIDQLFVIAGPAFICEG